MALKGGRRPHPTGRRRSEDARPSQRRRRGIRTCDGGVPDEGRNQTHSGAISQGAEYLMKEAIRRTQMQSPKGRST